MKSGSGLDKYIKSCSNRAVPIGSAEKDSDDIGAGCVSTSKTISLYALFLTYARINDGMDSEMQPDTQKSESKTSSGGSGSAGSAKSTDCKPGDICWPIQGANAGMITSGRWFNAGHPGYDFGTGGVTFGTPVFNVADGEVMSVGKNAAPGINYTGTGYGPNILNGADKGACNFSPGNNGGGEHYVLIKHNIDGKTFYSSYSHMQANSPLTPGQRISAGDQVGEVGSYGCSTGAHLHFATQTNPYGGNVDPKTYLGELR